MTYALLAVLALGFVALALLMPEPASYHVEPCPHCAHPQTVSDGWRLVQREAPKGTPSPCDYGTCHACGRLVWLIEVLDTNKTTDEDKNHESD